MGGQVEMDPEGTEEGSYRYDVLIDYDLGWLDKLCALGFNSDASGNDNYHDFAEIGKPHVYPFHPICYQDILLRCLNQGNQEQIRRDVLWNVLEGLNQYVRLQLSYGEPEPLDQQFWCEEKGHEILVVNPVTIPQIDADLDFIKQSLDQRASPSQSPPREDIFDKLPYELRHEIFTLLPSGSILALKAASWSMHITTLSCEFWRDKLKAEIPWLWEIHEVNVFHSQESEERASKVLLDIHKKSTYTSENDDYIMGLANRRRIWGVCEQIRARYLEGLACVSGPDN
ncbi:hypothetical protein F1880_005532 [Penicillium rolfsii]|nr:hypothetical protein F1880_005532 [Penicillium rolfsii]